MMFYCFGWWVGIYTFTKCSTLISICFEELSSPDSVIEWPSNKRSRRNVLLWISLWGNRGNEKGWVVIGVEQKGQERKGEHQRKNGGRETNVSDSIFPPRCWYVSFQSHWPSCTSQRSFFSFGFVSSNICIRQHLFSWMSWFYPSDKKIRKCFPSSGCVVGKCPWQSIRK